MKFWWKKHIFFMEETEIYNIYYILVNNFWGKTAVLEVGSKFYKIVDCTF